MRLVLLVPRTDALSPTVVGGGRHCRWQSTQPADRVSPSTEHTDLHCMYHTSLISSITYIVVQPQKHDVSQTFTHSLTTGTSDVNYSSIRKDRFDSTPAIHIRH